MIWRVSISVHDERGITTNYSRNVYGRSGIEAINAAVNMTIRELEAPPISMLISEPKQPERITVTES